MIGIIVSLSYNLIRFPNLGIGNMEMIRVSILGFFPTEPISILTLTSLIDDGWVLRVNPNPVRFNAGHIYLTVIDPFMMRVGLYGLTVGRVRLTDQL